MKRRIYFPYIFGRNNRPISYQYENIAKNVDRSSNQIVSFYEAEHAQVPQHFRPVTLSETSAFRRRQKMVRTSLGKYDVLQTGGGPRLRYLLSLCTRFRNPGLRHIHTLHIDVEEGDAPGKRFKRRLALTADTVTAVSRHTAETAKRELGVDPEVIYNGIDTDYFNPEREKPAVLDDVDSERPVFLFVGRLEPWKRPRDVIRVAHKLPDVTFLIRGSGSLSEQIESEVNQLQNVHLVSKLPNLELARLYANVTGLLFPSVREGCPTVVLEAFAAGTPVIGYQATSMPELVEDGETGLLCDPEEIDELVSATKYLCDQDTSEQFGSEARRYVVRRHDFARIAKEYQSLYE